MFEYSLF